MPTNTEIVQACFAAFQRGDVPAILNFCDDNVEWIEAGDSKSIPFAGRGKGKRSAAEFFRIIGETSETLKFEPQEYVANGDRVVALGVQDLRAKSTGKIARVDWAIDFTVRNGKVTRWQAYYDTAATQAAFVAASKASV
jgi:ketosteroid isomerase-like protein